MKRGEPMKRSGFKRKPLFERRPERQSTASIEPLRRGRVAMIAAPSSEPVVKTEYVRSKTLREACRQIPCQWAGCGREDGTVVAAHANTARAGKAMGLKASDVYVAALCFVHHQALDQGSTMSKEERQEGWEEAHARTVLALLERGLWPEGIRVPKG